MKYLANTMEVKITKVDDRNWKVTGHSPQDNIGRHFDIGTLALVPYESDSDAELVVSFVPTISKAFSEDMKKSWLEARPFTAKEMRELADLMDATGKAAAAEGLDIVAEHGIATAAGKQ
jgi:hypothetical protein